MRHHLATLDGKHDGGLDSEWIRIVQVMKQHASRRDLHESVINHPFLHDEAVVVRVADSAVQRRNLTGRKSRE